MAKDSPFKVERVLGLLYEGQRRGLGFLVHISDESINAKKVYDGLKTKLQQDVLNRFDYWQRGNHYDKYFHGWPNNPKYKDCFVFRWKEAGTYHRLYGFLFNPRPLTDPSYQLCILVSHARKNTEHTDPSELDGAKALRENIEVIRAIKKEFPEVERGK